MQERLLYMEPVREASHILFREEPSSIFKEEHYGSDSG